MKERKQKKRAMRKILDDMQLCIDTLRGEPCAGMACAWLCDLQHELSDCVKEALLKRLPQNKRPVFKLYIGFGGADWSDLFKGPQSIEEIRETGNAQ